MRRELPQGDKGRLWVIGNAQRGDDGQKKLEWYVSRMLKEETSEELDEAETNEIVSLACIEKVGSNWNISVLSCFL